MTKTSSKTRKTTTILVEGKAVKATPVRRRKVETSTPVVVEVVEASMAETSPAVEAPVAETLVEATGAETVVVADESVFVIPDLGVTDLVVSREGYKQLPGKTWHRMSTKFGKQTIRQAIAVMVKANLTLAEAIEVCRVEGYSPKTHQRYTLSAIEAKKMLGIGYYQAFNLVMWEGYRPHQVTNLRWLKGKDDALKVLTWISKQKGSWGPKEAYEAFPIGGKGKVGPFKWLVLSLDGLRNDGGKTSLKSLLFLAQAANLIGWIK